MLAAQKLTKWPQLIPREMVRFSMIMRCMSVIIDRTPAGSTETHHMATGTQREMVRFSMIMRCMSVIIGCTPSGSRETH